MNSASTIALMAANNASIAAMQSHATSGGCFSEDHMPLALGLVFGISLLGLGAGIACMTVYMFKHADDIGDVGMGIMSAAFSFILLAAAVGCFIAPFC